MNDNEKQFEDFVRKIKFDDSPDPEHRDKLEQELLAALTKQPRQQEHSPLVIWRTIMKSQITKLATAAVIIVIVVLSITFLDKSVTPAWAAEQTVNAFEKVNTVYYVSVYRTYRTENWARRGTDGQFLMGDFREQSNGGMTTVANDKQSITYLYNEKTNTVYIYKGVTVTTGSWLDMNFYRLLRDEMEDVNITRTKDEHTGKDCVSVAFKIPEEKYKKSAGRAGVILFDSKTKLPVSMTIWDNENRNGKSYLEVMEIIYNPEIPEETFEFEIPEGATVIEQEED